MKLEFYLTRWGSEGISFEEFCSRTVDSGYDGVEVLPPADERESDEMLRVLGKHSLKVINQCGCWHPAGDLATVSEDYRAMLERAFAFNKALPGGIEFITSQTGRDYYSFEDNRRLIEWTLKACKAQDLSISHETHRGKFAFAASVTMPYLDAISELKLLADFSHWCCVAESFLEHEQASLNRAIERVSHVHARVGYDEGPQVVDPRAPEWQHAVDHHLDWWQRVVDARKAQGEKRTTFTSEFGPFPYLNRLPYTQQDIANQWDINVWMMETLKERVKA